MRRGAAGGGSDFRAAAADPVLRGRSRQAGRPGELGEQPGHPLIDALPGTIEDRLDRIEAPTLLISGKYDEATPLVVKPYVDRVPGCEWVLFENSSHMPHVEEKQLCLETVSGFLSRYD